MTIDSEVVEKALEAYKAAVIHEYRFPEEEHVGLSKLAAHTITNLIAQEAKQAMLRQRAFDQKLIDKEANKARIDELELLGENYPPTNKFQHNLNLYIDARTIALTADKEQA